MSKITAEEIYEQERKKGNTDGITGNPEPDYNNRFYIEIFQLMQEHTKQNIEALRIEAKAKINACPDSIDKLFNQFLENIK